MLKFILLALTLTSSAHAGTYFVRDAKAEKGVTKAEASAVTDLVKKTVSERPGDSLLEEEEKAGYVLQPQALRVQDSLLITVEKRQFVGAKEKAKLETLFASQQKVSDSGSLEAAVRTATLEAIAEPSLAGEAQETSEAERKKLNRQLANNDAEPAIPFSGSESGATTEPEEKSGVDVLPPSRPHGKWNLGAGIFYAENLSSQNFFYGINGGYAWLMQPHIELDAFGEFAISTDSSDANWLRMGGGANYFFRRANRNNVPYVSADLLYGFVNDATGDGDNGFGVSAGAGFRFFKANESSLDLSVKYSVIFARLEGGNAPSSVGLNLSVNF